MAIKKPFDMPYAHQVRKMYGLNGHLGNNKMGHFALALENTGAGVFRVDNPNHHQITVQERFYMQNKPRTANQIAAAQTFKNGMAEWGGLTDEQKNDYNEKAKKYRIEGVNLFMREYMLSH